MKTSFEIIQTIYGNFLINEFDCISYSLKKDEMWEDYMYAFYSQILDSNDICIDAGANLGFHSIQFGKLAKHVYSFEPQPMIYNQLCANILFNDLNDKITPYRLGLGEKESTKQMWSIKNEFYGINSGEEMYNWGGRGIEHIDATYNSNEVREEDLIKVIPLDSLNIEQCSLFKIDIQGYEWYAFQGAQKLLENNPIILLENNSEAKLDKQVLNMLLKLGYQCYRFCMSEVEDCILIHPKSDKYNISTKIIKSLPSMYKIKKEF